MKTFTKVFELSRINFLWFWCLGIPARIPCMPAFRVLLIIVYKHLSAPRLHQDQLSLVNVLIWGIQGNFWHVDILKRQNLCHAHNILIKFRSVCQKAHFERMRRIQGDLAILWTFQTYLRLNLFPICWASSCDLKVFGSSQTYLQRDRVFFCALLPYTTELKLWIWFWMHSCKFQPRNFFLPSAKTHEKSEMEVAASLNCLHCFCRGICLLIKHFRVIWRGRPYSGWYGTDGSYPQTVATTRTPAKKRKDWHKNVEIVITIGNLLSFMNNVSCPSF